MIRYTALTILNLLFHGASLVALFCKGDGGNRRKRLAKADYSRPTAAAGTATLHVETHI